MRDDVSGVVQPSTEQYGVDHARVAIPSDKTKKRVGMVKEVLIRGGCKPDGIGC
jgi:hypothetical protein